MNSDRAGDRPPGAGGSGRSEEAHDRATAAIRRQGELAQRRQELSDRLTRLRAGQPSGPEDAVAAAEAEEAERRSAVTAEARAAEALQRSADAHDRAAVVHERAAAAHVGDESEHRARAQLHRQGAAEDRRQPAEDRRQTAEDRRSAGMEGGPDPPLPLGG